MLDFKKNKYALIIATALFLSAFLAYALTPRNAMADSKPKINLEKSIPTAFADWKLDERVTPVAATPELQDKLDNLYSQIVSRTYINDKGEQIMLSIAYGRDQGGDGSQVHRPEYCYPAQGFELKNTRDEQLKYKNDYIPVRRLLAVNGSRTEPISYWVTVGETALRSGFDRKLAQISYGLKGTIPDGLLFRVSNISTDIEASYQLQEKFTNDLLNNVDKQTRIRLAGNLNGE
ncbi:EpsI family protein [Iodobacter sp. CM08]|uniref:exosortase-associated protein EpsI, B-type n=1 Tax=Iodobacter sp. CM08 TaxID=3085902 RepID=UPI0029811326|nr:exosortase-associated protein EpsI, B-type [Iodobacter sp. CM08]MDW5416678.1 EpsI family protein [Iodobacter sp. CM08]